MSRLSISIIVCTHNRAEQLQQSLSNYKNLHNISKCEIIVVLNACTDNSEEITNILKQSIPQIQIIKEQTIGHSIARNTGFRAAKSDFVFYIDDDAYPRENLISQLLILKAEGIKCISGRTLFWRIDEPDWINNEYVEVPKFRNELGLMPENGYINGCACGFSKDLLSDINGFSPKYGMEGKKVGYYDEIYVQKKIEEIDIEVYYSPELVVYHRSHFRTIKGFLISAYKKGFYYARYNQPRRFKKFILIVYLSLSTIPKLLIDCIRNKRQSAILDYLMPIFNNIGQLFYTK